jgi:hypothetical protein
MNATIILILLFIVLIFSIVISLVFNKYFLNNVPESTLKWTVTDQTCNIDQTIKEVLDSYGIRYSPHDKKDWEIYIPCTYNNLSNQINDVPNAESKKIFILDDADEICGKDKIWHNLCISYGRELAKQIIPCTYILSNDEDMQKFEEEYEKQKLYILKKNIQRQEGLLITNNKEDIINAKTNGYVIVQELLQDPYLINGRKINMRFYVLVTCTNGKLEAYVHNNGFMYYTAEKFKMGDLTTGPNITTGYIDRQVYIENPLTHMDFRTYLDTKERELNDEEIYLLATRHKLSNYVFGSIYSLLGMVIAGMQNSLCKKEGKLSRNTTFQLFGADVAINNKLEPQIMEFNKGPDLDAKDERDKNVKLTVIKDMFNLLDITSAETTQLPSKNGFIKIL